jgi:LysR family transcriptional regulator (chromosome initiation inhibitor)
MRYLPVCTPAFAARWFDGGAGAASLAAAPVIVYDRKDDLQDRYLRRFSRKPLQPPRHYVPAAQEFGEAIRLGMGWGLLPELELGDDLDQQTLQTLAARSFVDVPLHWQQWRYGSAVLDGVAAAIEDAARVLR